MCFLFCSTGLDVCLHVSSTLLITVALLWQVWKSRSVKPSTLFFFKRVMSHSGSLKRFFYFFQKKKNHHWDFYRGCIKSVKLYQLGCAVISNFCFTFHKNYGKIHYYYMSTFNVSFCFTFCECLIKCYFITERVEKLLNLYPTSKILCGSAQIYLEPQERHRSSHIFEWQDIELKKKLQGPCNP